MVELLEKAFFDSFLSENPSFQLVFHLSLNNFELLCLRAEDFIAVALFEFLELWAKVKVLKKIEENQLFKKTVHGLFLLVEIQAKVLKKIEESQQFNKIRCSCFYFH